MKRFPELPTGEGKPAPPDPFWKDGRVFIVEHSHSDIAWDYNIERESAVRNGNLAAVFGRMRADPGFKWTIECVLYYRDWIEKHPETEPELLGWFKEKRLDCGASYTQPFEDCLYNELLARQMYAGKRWFEKRNPGVALDIVLHQDGPLRGHQTQQVYARAGVRYIKGSRMETPGFFRWKSPDGSSLLAWMQLEYWGKPGVNTAYIAGQLAAATPRYRKHGLPPILGITWGWDYNDPVDLSGAIRDWNACAAAAGGPQAAYGTFAEVLREVERRGVAGLPEIRGGVPNWWVYEHWPSHNRAMSLQREAGRMLPVAETLHVIKALLGDGFREYPSEKLDRAWLDASFACHTMVPAPAPAPDSVMLEKYRAAAEVARSESAAALGSIAGRIEFRREGTPLVVFNALSWPRSDPVEVPLPAGLGEGVSLSDSDGKPVPCQTLSGRRLVFVAEDVPPVGLRSYFLIPKKGETAPSEPAAGSKWTAPFETAHYRATPGPGGLTSLVDKEFGREVFSTLRWAAGEWICFATRAMGACEGIDFAPHPETFLDRAANHKPDWICEESGPVLVRFATARFKSRHCTVRIAITFYRTLKRIDWTVGVTGNDGEIGREQRLMFPIRAARPEIAYEVPFGVVEPGKDEPFVFVNKGRFAAPSAIPSHPREVQDWVYATGDGLGVTIGSPVGACAFGDFGPGADRNLVILSPILLAGIGNPQGKAYRQPGDFGFRFSLFTRAVGWRHGSRLGVQSQTPLLVTLPDRRDEKGTLPETCSFFAVEPDVARFSAVKKAEDDDSVVFRVYNMSGAPVSARIRSRFPFAEVAVTDLIESGGKPLTPAQDGFAIPLQGWGIETIKARPRAAR
ncbi:MAG: glycosyl hydrolase-related protein [Planctomycetota bacterium]|nr:glycosyl hydrolase-related protein [Planctomycetota bacterium]